MNMFLLAQAASPDPMAAMLGSPTFKSLATYLLIGIAILALFYPAMLAKIKAGLASIIDKQLHDKLPSVLDDKLHTVINSGGALPAPPFSPFGGASTGQTQQTVQTAQPPAPTDVGQVVQQRATALKAACPKAPADLRLKWLEQGFDTTRAQTDYINVLEGQVAGANTNPATPPTPPGV